MKPGALSQNKRRVRQRRCRDFALLQCDKPVGIAYIKRFIGDLELKVPARQVPPVKTREATCRSSFRPPSGTL